MTDLSPRRGIRPLAKVTDRPGPIGRKPSRIMAIFNDPNFAVVVIVALTGLLATLALTLLFSSGATEVLTQF
jgi:hypothetical protein